MRQINWDVRQVKWDRTAGTARLCLLITENSIFSVIKTGKAIRRPVIADANRLAGEPGVTTRIVRDKVWEN